MPTSHPSATTNSPVKLKFDDKLTGRGLSSEGLQRKLKSLLDELSSITESEPENIDLASFATVRKDLVGPSLMLHKDKGVKAYTACCIAELLNIYAPDAPYTAGELKDIFQFFFRQLLSGLKGPDAPYYQLYHDLLSSLSRTKSAVLVCDLPQADDLLVEIFRDFFTLAALGLPTTIEAYMADIMAALLDECQTVPSEVADILIKQFSTKKSATSVPAFRVAVEVCNASSDKLIRPVCQYFTDAIVQHPQSDHEDGDDGDGERDVDALRAAHTLVKRIQKYCPKLLLNVIPQMHEELQVDNTEVRTLATQTLGEMYAETHGSDLMREYRSTWVLWVARKNDKIPAIRLVFVSVAKKLIGNPDMRNDINDAMLAKALDPDDKVRAAVCKAYGELDFEMSAYHASEKMLRTIAGRCLDKKHTVRLEAFDTIGRLYSQARPEIEKGNPTAISQFGWIPSQLIHASGTTPDVALVAEGIIARDILPLPSIKEEMDENAWTQRLLSIMVAGERRTFDGLMFLSSLSTTRPSQYQAFVDSCLQFNGGTIDKDEAAVKTKLQQVIRLIAAGYPNPSKVADDLQTFAKHHDRRLYKYLRTIMDIETDLKGLVKAKHEFTKIIEKDVPAIAGTMEAFMRKSSLWIVNTSSIPTFLDILSSSGNATASRNGHNTNGDKDETINGKSVDYARATLNYISKYCPQLYYPHLQRLAKVAHSKGNYVAQECALRALASVARLGTDQFPNDSRLDSLMVSLAVSNNRTNAKAAARYLSNGRNSAKHSSSLVEKLCKLLPKADDEHLVAHIAALSEFTRYSPDEFEEKSEDIVRFLLRDLVHRTPDAVSMDIDEESDAANVEWCPRDDLHPLIHAKRGVMRLLTNRCLAHKDGNDAEKVAQPVIKLLADVLDQDGSFAPIKDLGPDYDRLKDRREGGPPARSWMRLKAVNCLLRLARQDKLVKVVNTRLTTIALVAQDFCWNVRNAFITKVTGLLKKNQINPVFNTVVFLTCHDPEDNIRSRAQIYVVTMMRRLSPQQKLRCFEQIFVRYLYLLAHHPDFDTSDHEEGLPALAKYIEFYLELVADNDNVSLLFYLAQQLKTVRDNDGDQYSENIYLLSELAEYIIKQWAANHSWTLVPYPGKVSMPPDSFTLLPMDVAKRVRTKVYLTDGMIGCLSEVGKSLKPAPAKRKRRAAGSAIPKSSKRPVKRRKKEESDEEDEIEESDEESAESGAEHPAPTSDEEMVSDVEESTEHSRSRSPELGRGARSRAKAKAQQKTKKGKKRDG